MAGDVVGDMAGDVAVGLRIFCSRITQLCYSFVLTVCCNYAHLFTHYAHNIEDHASTKLLHHMRCYKSLQKCQ